MVKSSYFCFNTSHVVIYQSLIVNCKSKSEVSIHLMLLFIQKYQKNALAFETRFNTSHVVIYPTAR